MAPIKRATLISTTRSDPAVISFSPAPVVSSVLSLSLRSSVPVLLLRLLYVTPSLLALSPLSPRRIVRFHSLFRTRTRTRTCIRFLVRFASRSYTYIARKSRRELVSCTIRTQMRKLPFEHTPTYTCRRRCTYKASANRSRIVEFIRRDVRVG